MPGYPLLSTNRVEFPNGSPFKREGITYFVIPAPHQVRDKLQRESMNISENQVILDPPPKSAEDDKWRGDFNTK
jgi:hypothetical protein